MTTRKNIPTAEFQSLVQREHQQQVQVTYDSDLQEVYDTEWHLLYVACTRARDRLMVTSVEPASEFVDDLAR